MKKATQDKKEDSVERGENKGSRNTSPGLVLKNEVKNQRHMHNTDKNILYD